MMKIPTAVPAPGLDTGRALRLLTGLTAALGVMTLLPADVDAQGRGNARRAQESNTVLVRSTERSVVLSSDLRAIIRTFYGERPSRAVASLPPGIRKNLARGKPLPPGIARRFAPTELSGRARVPQGYRLVEMGPDLLLVEIATNLIHDILLDVVR